MAPGDEKQFKEKLEIILRNERVNKSLSPINQDILDRIDRLDLKNIDFKSVDLDKHIIKDYLILLFEKNLNKGVDEIARALEKGLKTISDKKKTEQTEPGNATEQTEPGNATEQTEPGNASEQTEPGNATEQTEPGNATEQTEPGNATEQTELGNATEQTELGNATEQTELGNTIERTGLGNATERTRVGKAVANILESVAQSSPKEKRNSLKSYQNKLTDLILVS